MRTILRPGGEVRVYSGPVTLARAVVDEFHRAAAAAVAAQGRFRVALAGGSTPRAAYELLAADAAAAAPQPPWNIVQIFFGDERSVPPDHPASNFRMTRESLLDRVPIPPDNVFRFLSELPATSAAERYEETLRAAFALPAPNVPQLDWVLLGLGADGHTASLFPRTAALQENTLLACANHVPQIDQTRLTLTLPLLNRAAEVCFVVSGAEKAAILDRVLRLDQPNPDLPASAVRPPHCRPRWLVDEAAAISL